MFGHYQQCHLRIEIEASSSAIQASLTQSKKLEKWLWPQQISPEIPSELSPGLKFTSWVGFIPVEHRVDVINSRCLRLILSQGIDGVHEWYWGEGWLQSKLEGVSILPLNLGHSLSLLKLRDFLLTSSSQTS